ncbi:hypothetical protein AWB79_06966 [Caballeronia hypogeia]|uniref:Uncharacterized protein n=1 Tax=Caballeronia hypogeia TaxID=1777140 RepID=A0A158DG68_9BURK|nr:hypothetical protein [Caballeronia hypogeia]SAK93554.1 hypothetical protein AWB79_06966 [Caballeronia hypogeia]
MRRLLLLLTFFLYGAISFAHADSHHEERHGPDDSYGVSVVFDANGKPVGPLVSYGRNDGVFLTVNGAIVFVPITLVNVNFNPSQSAQFQWLTVDPIGNCGGVPAITRDSGPRPSVATRTATEVTLSIAADTNSTPCPAPPGQTSSSMTFPVESTYALLAHYPEPLTLRIVDNGARHQAGDHDRPPMVYDAQGKPVGALRSYMGQNGVFLRIDGSPVFVQVGHKRVLATTYSASQFEWTGYVDVPYSSADCSAGVLVVDTGSPTPAIAVRDGVDVTLYIAGNAPSMEVTVDSFRLTDLAGATLCESLSVPSTGIWTPRRSYSLTQHYPEPLRVGY